VRAKALLAENYSPAVMFDSMEPLGWPRWKSFVIELKPFLDLKKKNLNDLIS